MHMTKAEEIQALARLYKGETGATDIDIADLVEWAVTTMGWPLPVPATPKDRLTQTFKRALREEVRHDGKTGRPYRANHAVPVGESAQGTLWRWVDIDTAPRKQVHKSLVLRREQMVDDGVQLSLDMDHWNSTHPNELPIEIVFDFEDDVEWRKAALDEQAEAG